LEAEGWPCHFSFPAGAARLSAQGSARRFDPVVWA
jgi:hypothetical protein